MSQIAASPRDLIAGRSAEGGDNPYRSLTQIIVGLLRERILSGEYRPGARLIISDLAQSFGASPVPVREALRNLETEGLVDFRVNRGVVVRELSASEVRELFVIRCPLEALAGVEAARWATGEAIASLRAILVEMDAVMGADAWHGLHYRFHEEMYRLCRLPRLIKLVEVLRAQMRAYSRLYLSDEKHVTKAQKEHYALLDALRDRDGDRFRVIIYEHLARPARMAIQALGPGGADESILKLPQASELGL